LKNKLKLSRKNALENGNVSGPKPILTVLNILTVKRF